MKEDNDSIIRNLQLIQFIQQPSHIPVNIFTHRQSRQQVESILLTWISVPHHIFQVIILELIPPTIRHLHGAVWRIIGNIGKEGFLIFDRAIDEVHRFGCEIVDTKALPFDQFSISFHQGIVVMPPMPGTKSIEIIKPSAKRMVWILHTIVPFTECTRRISCSFEKIRNCGLIQVHALSTCGCTVYPTPDMVSTRQEFSPGGRTNWTNKEAVKSRPLFP